METNRVVDGIVGLTAGGDALDVPVSIDEGHSSDRCEAESGDRMHSDWK